MGPFDFGEKPITQSEVDSDADLEAIAALTGTGLLARTAANTWALRSIAGTANEITVTNGDGVSGNPLISLPTALTFTGKTVTGGTFNAAAISIPTFTQGSVLFTGAGGVVSENNSKLYWDNTNSRFGIGVIPTSQTVEIQVNQNASTIVGVKNTTVGSSAAARFYFTSSTCSGSLGAYDSTYSLGGQTEYADKLVLHSDSTASALALYHGSQIQFYTANWNSSSFRRMVIDGSGLIGINTTTPTSRLHVNGVLRLIGGSYTNATLPETVSDAAAVIQKATYLYTEDSTGNVRRLIGMTSANAVDVGQSGTSIVASVALRAGNAGYVSIIPGGGESVRATSAGNTLFGTTTETASGGLIQLATGTTAALGILAGTDTNLYRNAANSWKTDDALTVANDCQISITTSAVNYVGITGATTTNPPKVSSGGADTNISLSLTAKGTGGINLQTAAGTTQVSILDTASATRSITLTGSNGGNPTIGVTAGDLAVTPNIVGAGSIKTAAPNTGTAAAWKLGSLVGGQVGLTLVTTQYIELDIGGTLYRLATV